MIRTVTKDIQPKELGWCQCHEHIFIADGPSRQINEALHMDDYDKSLAEVKTYRKAGGRSIVDAQPYRCGRMAEKLVEVSLKSGVNIIACTGFHKTEFFEDGDWLRRQSEESLAAQYIEEIKTGMAASDKTKLTARAGVIKCAAVKGEYKANKTYEKLFRAAACAAQETNAPLMVHMDSEADAIPVITFFMDYHIKPEKIILCHLDRTIYDYEYHKELTAMGVYLEYDTIHRYKYHSDEKELALVEHMVANGYTNRILLGLDTTNQRLKSYGAVFGLDYILLHFKEQIGKKLGDCVVDRIIIDNPAIALSM